MRQFRTPPPAVVPETGTARCADSEAAALRSGERNYSGSMSPDPPNSFGKSLNFGRPSRTDMTFSP